MNRPTAYNKDIVDASLLMSRVYCGFMGALYLFGQLFFSNFDVIPTFIAVSALSASIFTRKKSQSTKPQYVVVLLCVLGALGVLVEIYGYLIGGFFEANQLRLTLQIFFIASFAVIAMHGVAYRDA